MAVREKIFIAWGGNKALANAVSERLRESGYEPQVGGDINLKADDFFLGGQVLKQISHAPRAIILAQWPAEDHKPSAPTMAPARPRRTKIAFRPNLMFEFGYLAARLQPSYLHLFLIGIKRADLPSDLLGIRAEEVELHSVSEMAADIVDRFRGQLHYPQIEPLEIFRHWSRWKHWIESQVNNEEAPDHRLGEVLLHSIQPAFYMGELPQLQSYCKKVHDSHTSEVTAAKRIIAPIVRYNSIADSEDPARISAADLKPITDALSMPPELDPAENPSMYWFETVRTDYLALCYYQLAGISGRQKAPGRSAIAEQKHYLEKAETAISQADGFLRSTPQSRAQHDAVYCLWQGYILRNWGRIRTAAGDLEKAAQLYSEAVEARKHAYAGFLAEDIDHAMLDQIEVEILLADLDMVQLNPGSSSLILGQAVDTLLEKQKKWIGLWTRAFVQAEQLAVMHGLEDIAQKLREKLHHGAH